jgi:hypothetical protein
MNTGIGDRLSFCLAFGIGLGVSTGHPAGIIVAAVMPLACLTPATRKAAFRNAFAYYVAGLWPIVPGLARYFGDSTILIVPLTLWILTAILLSVPWTVAWTSQRSHFLWRAPLALTMTIVPPLGIIGLASPITASGYLFPGTAWVGLAVVVLLPGIVLSAHALAPRRRCLVLCLVSAFAIGLAIGGRLLARGDAAPPAGWTAVNTHFGDVRRPFSDFFAAQFVQQKAAETSARVLIFPESVVPRWSESTEVFWRRSLNRCRMRGQILAIGAGLPAKTETTKGIKEELSDLRSFDFSAALDVLKRIDPQSPPARLKSVLPNPLIKPRLAPVDNTLLIVGAESGVFYQRVPVPVGMWRPFTRISVPLRLNGPGVLNIDHQRAAVLICYEQMLTFPILASMLEHPTVIVGISNTFWVDHTTIPRYQATALRGWAKLFNLPYFSAVNS